MVMVQSGSGQLEGKTDETQDHRDVKCSICSICFRPEELEGHICLEHLDYFPYSCGHCGHFFATDILAHFHANKKKHFPVKIREHPDMHKEEQLEQFVQATTNGQTPPPPDIASTEHKSNAPPIAAHSAAEKAREEPKIQKEQQLLESDSALKNLPGPGVEWNTNSPSSNHSGSLGDLSQAVDFSLDKVKTEPTEQDLEAEAKYESMVVTEEEVMFIGELSAQQAANALTEIETLFPMEKDQPAFSPQPESDSQSMHDEHECNICKVVTTRNKMVHAKRHFQNQNNFVCFKCDFMGKNAKSIRTHVSWKHKEVRPRDGVREVEGPVTLDEMFEACFGVKPAEKEQDEQDDDEPPPKKHRGLVNYIGLGQLIEVDEEEQQFVNRVVQMPSGRKYKYMECQLCGMEVCDSVASVHIFQLHIKENDMVKCGHCDFGSTYDPKTIRVHSALKHPGEHSSMIDRRQEYRVQKTYKEWRQSCFPLLKGSSKKMSGPTSGKEAPVQTPIEELHVDINSQEAESHPPKLTPNHVTQEQQACPEPEKTPEKRADVVVEEHSSPLLALLSSPVVPIPTLDRDPEVRVEKTKKTSTWSTGGSSGMVEMRFSPIVEDAWCNKCSVVVLRREVDDHIWYAHLGGVLPYRCGRCQRFFVTMEAIKQHWSSDHESTSAVQLVEEMEVVQSANTKFIQEMSVCFPEHNSRPSVIISMDPSQE